MPAKKKEDIQKEIMARIMSGPVPNEGQLKHPIQPKKRVKNTLSFDDLAITEEKELSTWSTRDFVDYFAKRYQEEIGGNYRKSYVSDCGSFQKIIKFMSSNGLPTKEYTKNAIEWALKRRDYIIKKRRAFTPLEIVSLINYYYQEEIMPQAEKGEIVRVLGDTSLLDEINSVVAEKDSSKERKLFIDFGIPIVATHLVKIRGFKESSIHVGVQKLLDTLSSGNIIDKENLGKIFMASIIGSPYPQEFVLLDWREIFATTLTPYKNEDWFRDKDYNCKYLPKYNALLGECDETKIQI